MKETGAVRFLHAFAQAVATLALYREGHPARERAIDAADEQLRRLLEVEPHLFFTFLPEEVVCGREPLRELADWDWARRLARAGIQRLEFDSDVTRDDLEAFLDEVAARLTLVAVSSADARPMRSSRIRFGSVGLQGEEQLIEVPETILTEPRPFGCTLTEEADTLRWLHDEVATRQQLHLAEAEAVVRSLAVAMHGDREMLIPLLQLKQFDEYTTTHALNVSVLAMALTEFLGLSARDVRTFGVAGLLHDIGKVRVPHEILTKPGKLTPEERVIINGHTVEGARIIVQTQLHLDLAAVVAYEHHIMIDGGGYPALRYRRDCHYASRIVHVCDVYDALRTKRPYRDAWDADRVLDYIGERAGTEFDPIVADAFIRMMRKWEARVARVTEAGEVIAAEAGGPVPVPSQG
ncbi:MAG TPA: HD domain-containing phosphohydrolase [Longimicrobiales bacterium]